MSRHKQTPKTYRKNYEDEVRGPKIQPRDYNTKYRQRIYAQFEEEDEENHYLEYGLYHDLYDEQCCEDDD